MNGGNRGESMPVSFCCSLITIKCLVRCPLKIIRAMLLEVVLNRITCLASLLLGRNLLGIISALHGITSCVTLFAIERVLEWTAFMERSKRHLSEEEKEWLPERLKMNLEDIGVVHFSGEVKMWHRILEATATDSSERDDQRREVSHALANNNGSLRFTRPPRTGDNGVEDRGGLCVCISICKILHNFAIFYDFGTFSFYRGCIASLRFTRWIFMLGTWEGGWDSGSSCWTLGREAGIVDLHVGHLGRRLG